MQPKQRFEVLDGMRGIAAILVMLLHYNIQQGYRIFYNGFTAVDFFFILSGFVILHSYGEKLFNGMSALEFIFRRAARLLPLSAAGVLLGLPAFFVMMKVDQTDYSNLGILTVTLSNMVFIPAMNSQTFMMDGANITGQLFPTDGPMWSIFFEFIVGFAFIFLVRWNNKSLLKLSCVSFFLIITYSLWNGHTTGNRLFDFDAGWSTSNFIGGFPRVAFGFTCGMLIYRITTTPQSHPLLLRLENLPKLPPITIYCLLLITLTFPFYIKGLYSLIEIGILAPLLVALGSKSICATARMSKISKNLGHLSFPIYCFHYPVFTLLKACITLTNLCDINSPYLKYVAIIITLTISIIASSLINKWKIQEVLLKILRQIFSLHILKAS